MFLDCYYSAIYMCTAKSPVYSTHLCVIHPFLPPPTPQPQKAVEKIHA